MVAIPESVTDARPAAAGGNWPLLATIVVLLGVSGGMLWFAGLNYDGLSGGSAAKIHPSTYLTLLLFGWTALASGNIARFGRELAEQRPAATLLLLTSTIFFLDVVLRKAPGMAGVLDTFVPPALLAMLLARVGAADMRRIEIAIHAIMGVNALLALAEFATNIRLFPYRFDGAIFETDLRSSALQGHPLANASLTAWYVLSLLGGGGTALAGPFRRLAMIALQCMALVTFGGRSAMVVTLVFGGGWLAVAGARVLARGRVPLVGAALAVLLATLIPTAIAALSLSGFFDALLARFAADGGSANARVLMLDLFGYLSISDLLLGPDPDYVDSVRRITGLEWGIENPIVRTAVYHGVLIALMQTVAVVLYVRELGRVSRRGTLLPIAGFAILILTAETLGGKTTLLSKFAVMTLCLFSPLTAQPMPNRRPNRRAC